MCLVLLLFFTCETVGAICLVLVWCTQCGEASNVGRSDSHELHVSHAAPSFFVWGQQSCNNSAYGPSKHTCRVNGWLFHVLSLLSVLPYIDCVVCIDCVVLHQLVCWCCSSHQWGLWGVDSFLLVLLEYSIGVVVVVLFDGVCSDCSMFWLSFSIVYHIFRLL